MREGILKFHPPRRVFNHAGNCFVISLTEHASFVPILHIASAVFAHQRRGDSKSMAAIEERSLEAVKGSAMESTGTTIQVEHGPYRCVRSWPTCRFSQQHAPGGDALSDWRDLDHAGHVQGETPMIRSIQRFWREEDGVTALEYGLLAAIVAGALMIFAAPAIQSFFKKLFETLSTAIDNAGKDATSAT
jgi:pilus assembly protein Flp/PilA